MWTDPHIPYANFHVSKSMEEISTPSVLTKDLSLQRSSLGSKGVGEGGSLT
jgi:hypothetical protein